MNLPVYIWVIQDMDGNVNNELQWTNEWKKWAFVMFMGFFCFSPQMFDCFDSFKTFTLNLVVF
jgi:hypothetical protein